MFFSPSLVTQVWKGRGSNGLVRQSTNCIEEEIRSKWNKFGSSFSRTMWQSNSMCFDFH